MDTDPTELVRSGYNALSRHYRGDDDTIEQYDRWSADLVVRLPERGHVLDLGCGCGVPTARRLTAAGHQVTGVDISDVQIERTFDAIVCLYALIHMPLDQQPRLLHNIARWLRPGGWLLATTGQDAWTGTQDNWLGGPATMWWSHTDATTYRSWLDESGLQVTDQQFVPEGDSGHALFWAQRTQETEPVQR
ncbi:class I SAM-dependent methyltransferase [Spirillospora sp. NBC_00431]